VNAAFVGSVSSSYSCLEALIHGGVEITCVLGLDESQEQVVSDFRSLRGLADQARLPFLPFFRVGEPAVAAFLRTYPADLLWVIGLSQLVPPRLLQFARRGGVGFHPTMLPRGRGRAPVAWTILLGERAAVSLFWLTDRPDAGDILAQREVPVLPDDYSEDLIKRTNEVLREVVLDLAPMIRSGELPRVPQDEGQATYYLKRTPADGLIDWAQPTESVYRLIRAAGRPYPGAFTFSAGRKVIIWRAAPASGTDTEGRLPTALPGMILSVDAAGKALVRTADGALWITEAAAAGGSEVGIAGLLAEGVRLTTGV